MAILYNWVLDNNISGPFLSVTILGFSSDSSLTKPDIGIAVTCAGFTAPLDDHPATYPTMKIKTLPINACN